MFLELCLLSWRHSIDVEWMSEASHLRMSELEHHHVYVLGERKQVEVENEQDL